MNPFGIRPWNSSRVVDEHLWFELSRDRRPVRELMSEGQRTRQPISHGRTSLASCPKVEGWSLCCLETCAGFEFTTTYEGTRFDPRRMWFLPLKRESHLCDLGIRVAVPGLDRMDRSKAHNAILVILDTGLGARSDALDLQRWWRYRPNLYH